jgi:hypothetical protein
VHPGDGCGRRPFTFASAWNPRRKFGVTLYHICAKHNAIESFKDLLSKWMHPQETVRFDRYEAGEKGTTFLMRLCRT